ncbi:MAG: HipA domain-containing protein [Vicingaceae bacterium]|nr:HipA domain-containing protein [Vicingaceae bacterium]
MKKCLICYKSIDKSGANYHENCLKNEFGFNQMPLIEIDEAALKKYAKNLLGNNVVITGVQPKLSLWLEESKLNIRFTIVDNKSNFIIKPQSERYKFLPENEDLCMHLASEMGIKTAKHSLVNLPSGNLAYITKRFDRTKKGKLASEDLCQLSETLTEHKYRGSYEKIGKVINLYSSQSGLDLLNFFELVLFNFIIGNADMHLKNFSMVEDVLGDFTLSPAYDLVATFLVIEKEDDELSLNLNGKKNRINKSDFDGLAKNLGLSEKQKENSYKKYAEKKESIQWWITNSFLPKEQKEKLQKLITSRIKKII